MPNDRSRRDSSLEVRPDMTAAQQFGVWLCFFLFFTVAKMETPEWLRLMSLSDQHIMDISIIKNDG